MPMIIGEIKRYLRDNNSVRVSRSVRDLAYKSLGARERLARRFGREPDIEEIRKELSESGIETDSKSISGALDAIMEPVSLFEPMGGEGGEDMCVMDRITDGGEGEQGWIEDISLREAMKKLSEREKNILRMRFFSGKTQTEIADEIGISQAQVSRLEKNALERIKKQM